MRWHDDLWVEPLTPKNGAVTVPKHPGHGLAFKPGVLSDHVYRSGE